MFGILRSGTAMLTRWFRRSAESTGAALEHQEEPVTRPARGAKWLEAAAYLLLAERHLAAREPDLRITGSSKRAGGEEKCGGFKVIRMLDVKL